MQPPASHLGHGLPMLIVSICYGRACAAVGIGTLSKSCAQPALPSRAAGGGSKQGVIERARAAPRLCWLAANTASLSPPPKLLNLLRNQLFSSLLDSLPQAAVNPAEPSGGPARVLCAFLPRHTQRAEQGVGAGYLG